MSGAGINSEEAFLSRAIAAIRELLHDSGRASAWEHHISPAAASVQLAKIADRRVLGSINELVFQAKVLLMEEKLGPFDVSQEINETPLSYLWKRGPAISPAKAFDLMARG